MDSASDYSYSGSVSSSTADEEVRSISSPRSEEMPPCPSCLNRCSFETDTVQCTVCKEWYHARCVKTNPPPPKTNALFQWAQHFVCPLCSGADQPPQCSVCNRPVPYPCQCSTCNAILHKSCTCQRCEVCSGCHRKIAASNPRICSRCQRKCHRGPRCYEHTVSMCSSCATLIPSCIVCARKSSDHVLCQRCLQECHKKCLQSNSECKHCATRESIPEAHSLGPMTKCPHCASQIFRDVPTTFCCSRGVHALRKEDTQIPPPLRDFFAEHAQLLIDRAREINQLASVTAIGVSTASQERRHKFPFTRYPQAALEIHGRVYHFDVFNSNPREHPLLGSAQSYIFVEPTEITPTERYNEKVVEAARQLRAILRVVNPFINKIRSSINLDHLQVDYLEMLKLASELRVATLNNSSTSGHQLMLLFSLHQSPFNSPQTAAVVRDSILTGPPISIPPWSQTYEQAAFPLVDPLGLSAWARSFDNQRQCFQDINGNKLTLRKYLKYKLCQSQWLRHVPRLTQEWIIDGICRSEIMQQAYLARIMEGKRIATQAEMLRATDVRETGRRWVIPSSVRGSHGYRRQKVEMGMSQVHRFGPPTLFITITANSQWPEIVDNLPPGQKWFHDLKLVMHVFNLKLKAFITDLKEGTFFSGRRAVYIQYVIEFQKRGLPHAHILTRLEGAQPKTAPEADLLTSAQLPHQCEFKCNRCYNCKLHSIVSKQMIHHCYKDRCRSNKEFTCKYNFPQPPCSETFVGEDGFWVHCRKATDSLVVPYNASMLLKYNCHINTLIAAGSRCILYLRKYLSKGPDIVASEFISKCPTASDALSKFYASRCLSSAEATWSALEFDYNSFWPTVVPVRIDLPHQQNIVFDEDEQFGDELEARITRKSHVELYFNRPETCNNLTFFEYFEQYSISSDDADPRRRKEVAVPWTSNLDYSNHEQFCLYCLLRSRPARSFNELLAGSASFEEAAARLGETVGHVASFHLAVLNDFMDRHLPPEVFQKYLATVAVTDTPSFESIFEQYWECCVPVGARFSTFNALRPIITILARDGIDPLELFVVASDDLVDIVRQLPVDTAPFFDSQHDNVPLSGAQEIVVSEIIRKINLGRRLFYLNGMAGSGKTHCLKAIFNRLSEVGIKTICSAYTGVAASMLPRGVTCHRLFKLPVDECFEQSLQGDIRSDSLQGRLLSEAQVLIIDEISMLHKHFFEAINSTLQRLTRRNELFGGKIVIIAGDFHQLPGMALGCLALAFV